MRQCPLCSRLYDDAAEFCPQDGRVLWLPDPLLGHVVDGKYHIDALLGGGGQSNVYRATHVHLQRTSAVKLVRGDFAADTTAVERFKREALAVAHLKHSNIITVHDFGVDDDLGAYLVMEYLEGRSLSSEISKYGRLAPSDAAGFVSQICSAVEAAHGAGVIHRDLKPDNVFIETRANGERGCKILDFGIAKLRDASELANLGVAFDTDPNLSLAGRLSGTPAYMSPEQCRGEALDPRTDIYSIGCIFYQLLTGQPPFVSDGLVSLVTKHVVDDPVPPSALVPGIPPALDAIVLRALAKSREDRFQTAEEMQQEIDALALESPASGAGPVIAFPLERRAAERDRTRTPGNVPQEVTTFVGRKQEIAELSDALAAGRLVTVTGPGGSGKTRIAIRVATEVQSQYYDGVWQVQLAPLADPALVPQAVASALGIRQESGRAPVTPVTDFLQSKQLLLLLDNCEHLIVACAEIVDAILRTCPQVRILATSQEPLGIFGEAVHPLPPLSLPDEERATRKDEIADCEAVRLFVDRARLVAPSFALTDGNAAAVARICNRLDGIPLAIELAAARVKLLSVEQLDDRLHDRFRLLTSGSRTADPRQRTLQAAIDWSYDLLDAPARTVFNRLSVFAGGFTLAAAEAVCSDETLARDEILFLLSNLVDKSLVLVDESGPIARYRMLQTIRQYGGEKLRASGEAAAVRTRHRDFYLSLAERAEAELKGPEQVVWLDRLETEHDNLRAALEWSKADASQSDGYLRLAGSLWEFWLIRGHDREGREWLESALRASRDDWDAPRAKALHGAGALSRLQGDYRQAVKRHQESIAFWRRLGDKGRIASALNHLGIVRQWQGDYDRARQALEEALALSREADNPWETALALKNLGIIAHIRREHERATELYLESLRISRSLDDAWEIATTLNNLAVLFASQGDYDRASELFEENLKLNRRLGEKRGIAMALNNLGEMAQNQGAYKRAAELLSESLILNVDAGNKRLIAYGLECFSSLLAAQNHAAAALRLASAAEALRERIGSPLAPTERTDLDRSVSHAREMLTPDEAAQAWETGRAMTLEQAVDEALAPNMHG